MKDETKVRLIIPHPSSLLSHYSSPLTFAFALGSWYHKSTSVTWVSATRQQPFPIQLLQLRRNAPNCQAQNAELESATAAASKPFVVPEGRGGKCTPASLIFLLAVLV